MNATIDQRDTCLLDNPSYNTNLSYGIAISFPNSQVESGFLIKMLYIVSAVTCWPSGTITIYQCIGDTS